MASSRILMVGAGLAIVIVLIAAFLMLRGAEQEAGGEETIVINVGLLVDETGPTSDVGRDYTKGAEAAFKYFNSKGIFTRDGVRVEIRYEKRDYAYNPARAEEFYREFRDRYGVIAIIGWGTADTEKLSDQVARDKIVYISASYSAKLTVKPYNFFPAPDYSTQACAGLVWLARERGSGNLALFYDSKVAYSRSPISAIKEAASVIGLRVVGDFDLPLRSTEADAERVAREAAGESPDYLWCGNTISSCSLLGRSMAKAGLDSFLLTNVWGFDERSPQLIGEPGYGRVAGVSPFLYPKFAIEQGVEGIEVVLEAARIAGLDEDDVNLRFLQGFLNVWLLIKAIEKVDSKDLLERGGEAIKEVLETEVFDFGGLTAGTLRFREGNHIPYTEVFIVVLGEDGELELAGKVKAPEGVNCAQITIEEG